jgi:cystathionine gamma-synthase
MERHCTSAQRVAEWLTLRPEVETVLYPGLAAHPGHAVAARQMPRGFGGMVSWCRSCSTAGRRRRGRS